MAHRLRIVVIGGGVTGRLVGVRAQALGTTILDWGHPPVRLTRQYGTNYLWRPLPDLACRQFPVVTCVDGVSPTPESILAYKRKIGKEQDGGDWSRQFEHRTEGWDLVDELDVPVLYNRRIVQISLTHRLVVDSTGQVHGWDALVSTIPMPVLLTLLRQELFEQEQAEVAVSEFRNDPVYVKIGPRPPDAPYPPEVLYVNYLTDPDVPVYRVCDRGTERHWEGLTDMGLTPTKRLVPGKIHPCPDAQLWRMLLQTYDVYCFGRYATWRPDELVHETDEEILTWFASL